MGRPMSLAEQLRARLHRDVQRVTPEHIFTTSGVVDPQDFMVGGPPRLFLVRKLLTCNCTPLRHKPGLHVLVEVTDQQNVYGDVVGSIAHLHPCLHGRWITEEKLTEQQARAAGLLEQPGDW